MARGKLAQALAREQTRARLAKRAQDAAKAKQAMQERAKIKRNSSKKTGVPQVKKWVPFESSDRVLLVGEGDFSFARALVDEGLVAEATCTSLDTEEELRAKYPSTITENLALLHDDHRAEVLHGVDGTTMHTSKPLKNRRGTYDRVVFNFPHLGNSVADQARNILQHQKLVVGFFEAARAMLKPGGVIVLTLFDSEPYFSWNVKSLAKAQGLATLRSGPFSWDSYPGYHHSLTAKEGQTSKEQASRPARTYVFGVKDEVVTKQAAPNDSDDE